MYLKFFRSFSDEIIRFDNSNIRKSEVFLVKHLGISYKIIITSYCCIVSYFILGRNIPDKLKVNPHDYIIIKNNRSILLKDAYTYFIN